jgi:peptide deformylase
MQQRGFLPLFALTGKDTVMVKDIVRDEKILSVKSEPATRADMQTVRDLLDTVQANSERCVGMAANMIGVHRTILVALIGDEYVAMINPRIVDKSKETYETEEGCLSLSGVRPVTRFRTIAVEYLDKKFKRRRGIFRDYEAEIIQHEMDHFEGKII